MGFQDEVEGDWEYLAGGRGPEFARRFYNRPDRQKRLPRGWYEYKLNSAEDLFETLFDLAALSGETPHELSKPQLRFEIPKDFNVENSTKLRDAVPELKVKFSE